MELMEKYIKVKNLIDKVDFSHLWNDFKPIKFALYNDRKCVLDGEFIEKTDQFIGNTAIEFNDEVIAIWNLENEIDDIILASKIVHEMFHGFQMLNNDTRFANELDALYNYKYVNENLSIKIEENNLIKELLERFEKDKFNRLLGLRKYRFNKYKYEFLYESKVEQIEGTANYIELKVLKLLSNHLFNLKINRMINKIITPSNLLPIRIISYDIGALLLYILKENNIDFDGGFSNLTINEYLIKDVSEVNYNNTLKMANYIEEYFNYADNIINKALSQNNVIEDSKQKILGVNVYDAIYHRGYIISKHCVMYGEEDRFIVQFGDFVIETKEQGFLV